jgi:hypothetical protein
VQANELRQSDFVNGRKANLRHPFNENVFHLQPWTRNVVNDSVAYVDEAGTPRFSVTTQHIYKSFGRFAWYLLQEVRGLLFKLRVIFDLDKA